MMSFGQQQGFGPGPAEIREHRGWFVAFSTFLIALGAIAMVAAFAATLSTVLFFGTPWANRSILTQATPGRHSSA